MGGGLRPPWVDGLGRSGRGAALRIGRGRSAQEAGDAQILVDVRPVDSEAAAGFGPVRALGTGKCILSLIIRWHGDSSTVQPGCQFAGDGRRHCRDGAALEGKAAEPRDGAQPELTH